MTLLNGVVVLQPQRKGEEVHYSRVAVMVGLRCCQYGRLRLLNAVPVMTCRNSTWLMQDDERV